MPLKRTPSLLGFPAKNEDIYTVINNPDGVDYIVDLINDIKTWIPYEIQSNDEEIVEYVCVETTDETENIKKPPAKKKAAPTVKTTEKTTIGRPKKEKIEEEEKPKKIGRPKKTKEEKKPTVYNIKVGEFLSKIVVDFPDIDKGARMKKAQEMYREWKLNKS